MHSDREQRKDPQSGPISGPVWISAFTVFLCFCGPLCANKISRCCYAAYFMSEMLGKYAEMGREFVLQMSNKSYVHHLNSIPNHPMHYLNNWKYSVDCLHRVTNFTNIFKQRVQTYGQEFKIWQWSCYSKMFHPTLNLVEWPGGNEVPYLT